MNVNICVLLPQTRRRADCREDN